MVTTETSDVLWKPFGAAVQCHHRNNVENIRYGLNRDLAVLARIIDIVHVSSFKSADRPLQQRRYINWQENTCEWLSDTSSIHDDATTEQERSTAREQFNCCVKNVLIRAGSCEVRFTNFMSDIWTASKTSGRHSLGAGFYTTTKDFMSIVFLHLICERNAIWLRPWKRCLLVQYILRMDSRLHLLHRA